MLSEDHLGTEVGTSRSPIAVEFCGIHSYWQALEARVNQQNDKVNKTYCVKQGTLEANFRLGFTDHLL